MIPPTIYSKLEVWTRNCEFSTIYIQTGCNSTHILVSSFLVMNVLLLHMPYTPTSLQADGCQGGDTVLPVEKYVTAPFLTEWDPIVSISTPSSVKIDSLSSSTFLSIMEKRWYGSELINNLLPFATLGYANKFQPRLRTVQIAGSWGLAYTCHGSLLFTLSWSPLDRMI